MIIEQTYSCIVVSSARVLQRLTYWHGESGVVRIVVHHVVVTKTQSRAKMIVIGVVEVAVIPGKLNTLPSASFVLIAERGMKTHCFEIG